MERGPLTRDETGEVGEARWGRVLYAWLSGKKMRIR